MSATEPPRARVAGVLRHPDGRARCAWCGTDPLYVRYHDAEWGVPQHDERRLFEMLCLEGAQAGLAWITVLRKRDGYRRAFDDFDAAKIARYTRAHIERLMRDAAIVRNRLKIEAFVANANAYLALVDAGRTLDAPMTVIVPETLTTRFRPSLASMSVEGKDPSPQLDCVRRQAYSIRMQQWSIGDIRRMEASPAAFPVLPGCSLCRIAASVFSNRRET
jgi:DNA-3-methyladenine glycosylase I